MAVVLGTGQAAWAQQQTPPPTAPPAPKPAGVQESQDPRWNLSAGYAYLNDRSWTEHLLMGYVASLTGRLTSSFAVVVEGGGSHGHYKDTGFTIQRYAFLGGLRLYAGEGEVRPFFQALAGYSRQGGDVGLAHGIAVQPGGGVDAKLTDAITLRAQGDYRLIFEDGEHYNQFRGAVSVIYYLGKRQR